jgi:hypothetical protein
MLINRVLTNTDAPAFDILFPDALIFDKVHAGALCAVLRDDERVLLAAHISDHTTLRIRLIMMDLACDVKMVAVVIQAAATKIIASMAALDAKCSWKSSVCT